MLSLGPVPMPVVLIALALASAWGASRMLDRPGSDGMSLRLMSRTFDLLLVGALAARLAFVLRWWPHYAADPSTLLRINDGGYLAWPGVMAALAFGAWRTRTNPELRKPLGATALAGLLAWVTLSLALALFQRQTLSIPRTELLTLDGATTQLTEHSGRPLVVNLWASWCPICRRTMPVLATAQAQRDDVEFAFVNQGESESAIREYLARTNLELHGVLRDPASATAGEIRSGGLPATLFFDAEGRLVETHLGALSPASLAAMLLRIAPANTLIQNRP